jgi:hypothetical protein
MSIEYIARFNHCTTSNVTFTTSIGTTGGFGLNTYAGGMLLVVSGSATLTFHVKPNESSSETYVVTSSDADLTLAVAAGKAYPLPDDLFSAGYVMAVSSSGNVVCKVLMKG